MKLVVHGVHVRLTPALKQHVRRQLAQPLERIFPQPSAELEVHLVDGNGAKGGLDKECRVTLRIPSARATHIVEATEDFYKSVSLARDRLERVAKRFTERWHHHHGEGAPSIF